MGRKLRDYAPGVAFHITGRMLEHWFDEQVAARAEHVIVEGVASSDALLIAHVVMPNHFHVVVRAGKRPLGWVMQPIMRRLALLVNRGRARHGPVFEGRFRSHACDDVDHLRRAIVYVHNNPLRKNLCVHPDEYAWHSHLWYAEKPPATLYIGAAVGLQLFARDATSAAPDVLQRNYLEHFAWRMEKDRCDKLSIPCSVREPEAIVGDAYFREHFQTRHPNGTLRPRDLRDEAIALLEKIDVDANLDSLRTPYLDRHRVRTRRELIFALLQKGHRTGKVATLLRVSSTVVSRCASQLRYAGADEKFKV